jgi:hypothetical protein
VRKYYNKIREVKQSVRKDKRNSINEMAGQAENSAAIVSVKELYRFTKCLLTRHLILENQLKI